MTEPSDAPGSRQTRPARDRRPSLLALSLAVLRGELTEQQALRILRNGAEDEEVQTSDA